MNIEKEILLHLTRNGLNQSSDPLIIRNVKSINWEYIREFASEQGVLAIAFDGMCINSSRNIIPNDYMIPRSIKIKWGIQVMKLENLFHKQYVTSKFIAEEFAKRGIRTVVLKGFSIARLYPVPKHRPCGDFDCFLMGKYEMGNRIAESLGAEVNRYCYKHSHILYDNLLIENHQFCTSIRGKKRNKEFEIKLQEILKKSDLENINDTLLLSPDPFFNALFLTVHSWGHFLLEGIKLRHVCDWVVLLKKHIKDIDWVEFEKEIVIRDRKIINFAESLSIISYKYFNTPLPEIFTFNEQREKLADRLLFSILGKNISIYNKNYNLWKGRFKSIENLIQNKWKFTAFCEETALQHVISRSYYTLFEKNPHI